MWSITHSSCNPNIHCHWHTRFCTPPFICLSFTPFDCTSFCVTPFSHHHIFSVRIGTTCTIQEESFSSIIASFTGTSLQRSQQIQLCRLKTVIVGDEPWRSPQLTSFIGLRNLRAAVSFIDLCPGDGMLLKNCVGVDHNFCHCNTYISDPYNTYISTPFLSLSNVTHNIMLLFHTLIHSNVVMKGQQQHRAQSGQ